MNRPFTGSLRGEAEDTTVAIPISYIRAANIKLIERKYFKDINAEKDSIIAMQRQYINIQENLNKHINKNANAKIARQRTIIYCLSILASVFAIISIVK